MLNLWINFVVEQICFVAEFFCLFVTDQILACTDFLFSCWRNVLAGRTRKSGLPTFSHRSCRYRSSQVWIMTPCNVVYDNLTLSLYSNGLRDGRLWLNSGQGKGIFLYSKASRPALRPTLPIHNRYRGLFPWSYSYRWHVPYDRNPNIYHHENLQSHNLYRLRPKHPHGW